MNQANLVNGPAYLKYGSTRASAPLLVNNESLLNLYCEGAVLVKPVETAADHRVAGRGIAAQLRENMVVEISGQPQSQWTTIALILNQLNRAAGSLICETGTPGSPDIINVPLKVISLTGVGQEFHRTALTGLPSLRFAGGNVVLQGDCTWTAMVKNGAELTAANSLYTATTGESFTVDSSALSPWSKPMTAELYAYADEVTPLHTFDTLSGFTVAPSYNLTPVRDPNTGTVNFRVTGEPTCTISCDEPDISATALHALIHRTGSGTGIGSGRARYKLKLLNGDDELYFANVFLTEGSRGFNDTGAPWTGLNFLCNQDTDGTLVTASVPA